MSSHIPPNPFPLNPIFNPQDWIIADGFITLAEANALYLKKAGDTATGLINFNAGIIVNPSITFSDGKIQTSAFTGAGALSGSYTNTSLTLDTNGKITAISSGATSTGLVQYNVYTSSQTITPPANVYKCDIMVFGSGGKAGSVGIFGSYLVFGGAGAGGNMATIANLPWKTSSTMTLSVTPQTTGGSTTLNIGSLGTAICYNGGNGSTGASGGGGAGGVANTTPNSLPTSIGSWVSYYGQNGSAGSSYSYPAGFPNPPNTIGGGIANTIYTAGMIGCGQSYTSSSDPIAQWNASTYTAGGCIITWYKTS